MRLSRGPTCHYRRAGNVSSGETPSEGQRASRLQLPLGGIWIQWGKRHRKKVGLNERKISPTEQHLTLCQTRTRSWGNVWVDEWVGECLGRV